MANLKTLKTLCLISLVLISGLSMSGCSTPQVLGNEEVYTSLDALWTAVTSRNLDRVQEVTNELIRLRDEGGLSKEGWGAIEPILQQAFAEKWEPAARSLKKFIGAQRKA